jgi:NAD(P)H-flavin reductase
MIPENCDFASGFVSAEFGMLPKEEPALSLPAEYSDWDELAKKLPVIIKDKDLNALIKTMSSVDDLDNKKHLARAALILGCCAHAYRYIASSQSLEEDLPQSIVQPWKKVCAKLGRSKHILTMTDFVYHNWRYKDPSMAHSIDNLKDIENLELLVPVFNNIEEKISNLGIVVLEGYFSEIVSAINSLEKAKIASNIDLFSDSLDRIATSLQNITRIFAILFSSNEHSRYYVNPSIWTTTFITFVRGSYPDEAHLTGLQTTIFHILDAFIGREFKSYMGKKINDVRELLPPFHLNFIKKLEEINFKKFVLDCNVTRIKVNFARIIEAYTGERGFLEAHKKIAVYYSYVGIKEMHRSETNSGLEENVSKVLQESIYERKSDERITNSICFTISACRSVGHGVFEVLLSCDENFQKHCKLLPGSCIQIPLKNLQHSGDEMRTYSIHRVDDKGIYLMIEKLVHENNQLGEVSAFLTDEAQVNKTFVGKILPPLHFTLPLDKKKTIIFIAGGNGVSPFIYFLHALIAENKSLTNVHLFLFAKNIGNFYAKKSLDKMREKFGLKVMYVDSQYGRQDIKKAINSALSQNQDAHIYVCGGLAFATNVQTAVEMSLGKDKFSRFIADKQLVVEGFTAQGVVDIHHYLSSGSHPGGSLAPLTAEDKSYLFPNVHSSNSIAHAMVSGSMCPYSFFPSQSTNIARNELNPNILPEVIADASMQLAVVKGH